MKTVLLALLLGAIAYVLYEESQSGGTIFGGSSVTDTSGIGGTAAEKLAAAIAKAEGFFASGSNPTVPQRANNPGDLKLGDKGNGTIGGKTVFQSVADGWAALVHQVDLMLTGKSDYYNPNQTFTEIAQTYTGNDNAGAWASIVAGDLGTTPDTKLGDWAKSVPATAGK